MSDYEIEPRNFNSRPHGGRPQQSSLSLQPAAFQLTPSRRATLFEISKQRSNKNFNSRPHGGRLCCHPVCLQSVIFQLTPSRRATQISRSIDSSGKISTHALTEGDCIVLRVLPCVYYFNSRPHGGRHVIQFHLYTSYSFQLTPSRRATLASLRQRISVAYFNSRPHGGRRRSSTCSWMRWTFQLTPSRRATNAIPDDML